VYQQLQQENPDKSTSFLIVEFGEVLWVFG